MTYLNRIRNIAIAAAFLLAPTALHAEEQSQYFPLPSYRVGPYAVGGSSFFGGYIDYMNLINIRDGGVNGVKLTWDECETQYEVEKGVECYERMKTGKNIAAFNPFSLGVQIALLARVPADKIPIITIAHGMNGTSDGRVFPYLFPLLLTPMNLESATFNYIGQREGGMENLKSKKIVVLYHGSPYGKEPIPVTELLAEKYGFELHNIEVPHPGSDQTAQWLQIRRINPDYILIRGWGVMNAVAITSAKRIGFPADKLIGNIWANSEEDAIPAGDAAIGYISTVVHSAGKDFPVVQDIEKVVYGAGKGNLGDETRIGNVIHNLGVVNGILNVEAIRIAQANFGQRTLTTEEVQWGFDHLRLDSDRIAELGATGLLQPIHVTCADHEGAGAVKFQQWDGTKWNSISDWVKPDRALTTPLVEAAAQKYAAENNITPRICTE